MRPIRLTAAAPGNTTPAVLDLCITPFNVGLGIVITGTATYTVQFTFDPPDAIVTWFNSSDTAVVAATTNQMSNIAFPVTAVRLNVAAVTGSVTMTVIQAGMPQ